MYSVETTSKDRWVFIFAEDSMETPDTFVEFVKEYETQLSGNIFKAPGDVRYSIDNDPFHLVFQWDSLFGITVVVPEETDISTAENVLKHLCEKLNQRIAN